MRKIVVLGILFSAAAFAQDSASKTAVSVDTDAVIYGVVQDTDSGGWETIASADIKPPGGKDLLMTVSMQSGLFNFRLTPPVGGDLLLQHSGLRVRVLVDGEPVSPGAVTWERTLNFLIEEPSLAALDINLRSGVRAFTFVKHDVGVGSHHIEVQASFRLASVDAAGVSGSFAFITNRTLTVESVSAH